MADRWSAVSASDWPPWLAEFDVEKWADGFVPRPSPTAARNREVARPIYARKRYEQARVEWAVDHGRRWLEVAPAEARAERDFAWAVVDAFEAAHLEDADVLADGHDTAVEASPGANYRDTRFIASMQRRQLLPRGPRKG